MEALFMVILVILGLALFIFTLYLYVRILHKAGYSGWWVLLLFVPVVNLIMIWVFAFADWPSLKKPNVNSSV